MDKWHDMITKVLEYPVLFVTKFDIIYLGHYLDGYSIGASEDGKSKCNEYSEFEEFVRTKYNDHQRRWYVLVDYNTMSHKEEIETFRELYAEFYEKYSTGDYTWRTRTSDSVVSDSGAKGFGCI